MAEFVRVATTSDGVAVLEIDNPPWNALSRQVNDELVEAADRVAADPLVRVLVVHGGAKLFCAGADLAEAAELTVEQYDRLDGRLERGIEAIAGLTMPTLAAITGHALGEGIHLAAAVDYRVAGDNVRFGLPQIRYAMMPSPAALRRMAGLIGPSRTTDLARSGRPFGAAEALRIGLVDAVVAPDEVLSEALRAAAQYRGRPEVLDAIKRAAGAGPDAGSVGGSDVGGSDMVRGFLADPTRGDRVRKYLVAGPAGVGD